MTELCYLNIHHWKEAGYAGKWQPFLSHDKKDRLDRMLRANDKLRLLAGDWLVRNYLSRKTGTNYISVDFGYQAEGKPFLRNFPEWFFNISHAGEYVLAAFSTQEVGVDIEQMKPLKDLSGTARIFMCREEFELFSSLGSTEQLRYFYRIWSAKESYIKQTGEGLTREVTGIRIVFNRNQIRIARKTKQEDDVYFKEFLVDGDYACCVCARDNHFADPEMINFNENP